MRVKSEYPALHAPQHLADGSDPLPGWTNAPAGSDLEDIILAFGPAAFWKLDELSGDTAHDSSGNGHDLTANTGAGYSAPTWGQTAGPPGTTTAKWVDSTDRVDGSLSSFTDNFTAGVWVNMHTSPVAAYEIIGQGQPLHGSGSGWTVWASAGSGKFRVEVTASHNFSANNTYVADTWYFLAVVRDAGTWKLYINGLVQAATITDSPGTGYGSNTWLGSDGYAAHGTFLADSYLSYAFIVPEALSSTDLLGMYDTGVSGVSTSDIAGKVLLADGTGNTYWDWPLEVTY